MVGAVALAIAIGCTDKGSIGNYDSGGSGSSEDSSGGGHTETSATGEGTSTSITGTDTLSDSDGDTGVPFVCADGNGCPVTMQCDPFGCGTVPSIFDENACVRPTCSNDDACGDGERCFVALDFGGCEGSTTECHDDLSGPDQACECGGTADCNGGHCVPAVEFPPTVVETLPTRAVLAEGCGPDDGPVIQLFVYDEGPVDGCTPPDGAVAVLEVTFVDAAIEVGEYDMLAAIATGVGTVQLPDDSMEPIQRAHMSITAVDQESAALTLDIDIFQQDVVLASEHWDIGRANVCPLQTPCGA
jgi:hypothetical protein